MAVTPRFTPQGIRKAFQQRIGLIDQLITRRLQVLGEQAVNMSRDSIGINASAFPVTIDGKTGQPLKQRINPQGQNPVFGDYLDQTANLRASIGYVVAKDGNVLHEDPSTNAAGLTFGKELLTNYPTGWVLIVYAGMEYAAAVESKGYNVISSAEHMVEDKLPGIMQAVLDKINKFS